METPGIDINYARPFSLPFGLAPATDAAYISALNLETGYVFYQRRPAPLYWPPEKLDVRGIPFANGSGKFAAIPASTTANLGFAATPVTVDDTALKVLAKVVPPVNGFRWDGPAAKTGPFPLPAYDDGALVMRWSPSAAVPPTGAVTNGIAENFLADYLLPTHAIGGDGEAARDLLRAPMVGLVRFERYRHFELTGAAPSLGTTKATTGAIVVRSRAGGKVPAAGHPPLLGSFLAVFENVDRASAVNCIGRLAWCSLIRREDVRKTTALKGEAKLVEGLLVQTYLDYLQVARPTHRPAMPDPIPLLAPALRQPFEKALPKPSPAQIEAVIDRCILDTTLRASFLDFVTTVFAEIVSGATWSDIGCTAVSGPPPAALADAHKRLSLLESSIDTWLPCFAGAPVGRAAPIVVPVGALPLIDVAPQGCLTPFHLEALTAAGQTAPVTTAFGSLAVLRIIHDDDLDSLLTTRDFLDAIVKGTNTTVSFDAPLDFSALATLNHPYAGAVAWTQFVKARLAFAGLETLRKHKTARGVMLGTANIEFWKDNTGLVQAGLWPDAVSGNSSPTPGSPYLDRTTRIPPAVSGFDEYDLEAVLRARSVVRDGRTGKTDIPVPLFLTLLDRESYRQQGITDRTGQRLEDPNLAPTDADLRAVPVVNWLVFPFGLDVLVRATPLTLAGPGINLTGQPLKSNAIFSNITPNFNASYPSIHARLVSLGLLATDLEPLLAEADCLAYLEDRRSGRVLKSAAPRGLSVGLRSRSAQWMPIALQMAIFQWMHQQLSVAAGTRHVTRVSDTERVPVNEYMVPPPPPPGAGANSDERRRFIAYWSTVYLAFNISPSAWNCWVNSVPDATIAAGTPVTVFLTFHKNVVPRNVEPAAHDGPEKRLIEQRGNMVRFSAGLDAYMRLGVDADTADIVDPHSPARTWPTP